VPQALDDIEEPDVLGALKRTLGAAEAVPQSGRSQQFVPHAIHYLSQDAAGTEVRFNGAYRASGSTHSTGKTALQMLAARLPGQLVFKLMIKILDPKLFHN
jgi:hypothetical protein